MAHPASDPEVRRSGLGASDMGTVLGLNPWKSAFELWLDKLGKLPPWSGNDATWFGNELEDIIAKRWTTDPKSPGFGMKVKRKLTTARHPVYEWAFCHIDRRVIGERSCLEIKTTVVVDDWGEPGTDEIPPHILVQCHHQLWVENLEVCYVAVTFLHRRKIVYYRVERSAQWDEILCSRGSQFWEYVRTEVEPPVDFADPGIFKAIKQAYGVGQSVIDFPAEAQQLHQLAETMSDRAKHYSSAAEELKAELLYMMRDAWLGRLPDGTYYRRQESDRKGFTVEPTTVKNFRHLKKPPKGFEEDG